MTSDQGGAVTSELRADCSRCAALCCLHLAFDRGSKFGLGKPAGTPCPLLARHSCSIHEHLTEKGFSGCVQFDCHGAGQIVVQQIFGGASWQDRPDLAAPMGESFRLLREVQDMRLQLRAARDLCPEPEIAQLCDQLEEQLTPDWSQEVLARFDLTSHRAAFRQLLSLLRQRLAGDAPGQTSTL